MSVGADVSGCWMKRVVLMEDPAVLDLLVHFLGLAEHHNVNAPPSWRGLSASRQPRAATPSRRTGSDPVLPTRMPG